MAERRSSGRKQSSGRITLRDVAREAGVSVVVVGAFAVRNNIFDVYIALSFGVLSDFTKRYNIPTTMLVSDLILGLLLERFFLTSPASYVTPAKFLLRPHMATIMGLAFLFLLWSL